MKKWHFLWAFACVAACSEGADDTLMAQANQPAPLTQSADCAVLESANWQAWVDTMPGPDAKPTLHVTGEVVLPTPGYEITWSMGALDRRQPPAQRLKLSTAPPDGMVAQVITTVAVSYAMESPITEYRAVIVGCGDNTLATIVDVTVVQ